LEDGKEFVSIAPVHQVPLVGKVILDKMIIIKLIVIIKLN